MHDGHFDIHRNDYDEEEIEGAMTHLHDFLVQVVLELLGYGGTYQPTATTPLAVRTADWVTLATSPASPGYVSIQEEQRAGAAPSRV